MKKCPMRLKIEQILNLDPIIVGPYGPYKRKAWIGSCNKQKTKYRMKIFKAKSSDKQINIIKKLPHVLNCKNQHLLNNYFWGIQIYFDCKPSQIKL